MLLLFWRTAGTPPVVVTVTQETMLGGGQEDFERWKAERRNREREIDRQKIEARTLRERLSKAEEGQRRKQKANAQAKSRKALADRVARLRGELEEVEFSISEGLAALAALEAQFRAFQILDQRRRLLLVALAM